MTTSYRDDEVRRRRQGRGSGSIRERSPGVWEVRVVVGFDPVHGRSVQRSFTIRGDAVFAHARRRELADDFGVTRVSFTCAGAQLRVGELLERFFAAPQLWAPATVASHRWVVRGLLDDGLARRRLVTLTAGDVRATIARWQEAGVSVATVSGRWLVLRSALSWSVAEGILRVNPVAGMRGPPRPEPRTHHTTTEVQTLLVAAGERVERAGAALVADPSSRRRQQALFVAEQTRLLVRLTADSAARRGELAVLRCSDLAGRVLTIERGLSHGVLGPTKSRRTRRLTLGATTAAMVHDHVAAWREPCDELAVGDWLFSHDPTRVSFITAGGVDRIASGAWVSTLGSRTRRCTGYATASPPISWTKARSSRPRPDSVIETPQPHCGTIPMRSRSRMRTSPTSSTHCSTATRET